MAPTQYKAVEGTYDALKPPFKGLLPAVKVSAVDGFLPCKFESNRAVSAGSTTIQDR
jgi:hypothetical protein